VGYPPCHFTLAGSSARENYARVNVRSDATQGEIEKMGSNHFEGNLCLTEFRPPTDGLNYRFKAMYCHDRDNASWLVCKRSDSADEESVLFGQELSDDEITRIMEDRWYVPLKKVKIPRPLENNSTVMFAKRLTDDEVDEEEAAGVAAADPLELFHDRSWYKPPRPVNYYSIDPEPEDLTDLAPKIMHLITTGPHTVRLMLRTDASIERITEVLRRRT
jgi:hypothetical protein